MWGGRVRCRAACGPPEQARAVAADEGGCLTVLVPDDCHHGTECNLLPAASFSLGSVATTLAMGAPPSVLFVLVVTTHFETRVLLG